MKAKQHREQGHEYRTQAEVAAVLGITKRGVAMTECRAIRKLWRKGLQLAAERGVQCERL